MNIRAALALAIFPALLTGCPYKQNLDRGEANGDNGNNTAALTLEEAGRALDEVRVSGEAASLVSGTIEISTNFTIGGAVQEAAAEIKDFYASQLPCAEITLVDNNLTVEYGVKPGNCTFHGHTYTGTHSITVTANDDYDVFVEHEWTNLSNGKVKVSGYADVTWSFDDQTRHVEHELTWTRLSDGKTGTGSGDRLQGALNGNVFEGFTEDGFRKWEGDSGEWNLGINEIEWQWTDPVPQTGSYVLETPNGKHLTLAFDRLDEDSITVIVSGTKWKFDFVVNKLGGTTVVDEGAVDDGTIDENDPV